VKRAAAVVLTAALLGGGAALVLAGGDDEGGGETRRYFLAAEEVAWDYAPDGEDMVAGEPFGDDAKVFIEKAPDRIGSTYKKALFRGYTDASFERPLDRGEEWAHLGNLGPMMHAEVGDTIEVVLRNDTKRPVSLHPHGLRYDKANEGAPYGDGTSGDDKADDAVAPGEERTYTWEVPERAGPGPGDGSSTMWMYMSHVEEVPDQYAGLLGPIIVTRKGEARDDGTPRDVDRELVANFMVADENASPYIDANLRKLRANDVNIEDEAFVESNLMHSINGYLYGNGPGFDAKPGERVRWYLMGMGTEVDLHTPHWHGQTATVMGMRTDVTSLLPGTMIVADMQPDEPGKWLFHCHVNDHITAGMSALFDVGAAGASEGQAQVGESGHGHG
jgi:FtsP/CotA-like multicopper oxidase with cupredoxin domain